MPYIYTYTQYILVCYRYLADSLIQHDIQQDPDTATAGGLAQEHFSHPYWSWESNQQPLGPSAASVTSRPQLPLVFQETLTRI